MSLQLTPEIKSLFRQQNDRLQNRFEGEKNAREANQKLITPIVEGGEFFTSKVQRGISALEHVSSWQERGVKDILDGVGSMVHYGLKKKEHLERAATRKRQRADTRRRFNHDYAPVDPDQDPYDYPWLWTDISEDTSFGRAVVSVEFDSLCALVIVMNAIFIGYASQVLAPNYDDVEPKNDFIHSVEFMFFVFYMFELMVKLVVWRARFFYNDDWKWNMFDFTLVVLAFYDVLISTFEAEPDDSGGPGNLTWLRLLRLLKMLKMLRVIRVMRAFTELRLLLVTIMASMRSLFWTLAMLALIFYIFGLCFLQGVTAWLEDAAKGEEAIGGQWLMLADEYFDSVGRSMLTLYMCVSGGVQWGTVAKLVMEAGSLYYYLFLFFITFLIFAVHNVLTGLFVERSMATAQEDRLDVMEEELQSDRSVYHKIEMLMESLEDSEHDGVTWKAFRQALQDESTAELFDDLGTGESGAIETFRILSNNFALKVNVQMFVTNISKTQGEACSKDMLGVIHRCKRTIHLLPVFMQYVEDSMKDLEDMFAGGRSRKSPVRDLSMRLKEFRGDIEEPAKTVQKKAASRRRAADQEMSVTETDAEDIEIFEQPALLD